MGTIQSAVNKIIGAVGGTFTGLKEEEEKTLKADERVQKRLDTLYAQRQKMKQQREALQKRQQEQIKIGGEKIEPGNPLYKKIIEQLGGNNG